MKTYHIQTSTPLKTLLVGALLALTSWSFAGTASRLVDDFSDAQNNSVGIPRQFLNDSVAGGSTTANNSVTGGVFSANGEIAPPRGQPGWASAILLLDPQGLPQDASAFEGVRLLLRVSKGNISLSANSAEVTNFDYHSAPISTKRDGQFHEVKIPFASMKRAWSQQTPLNTRTISSLSLVAFDIQKGSFHFEVDEVSFY